jgi:outer membrane lipopolysaccharide assembly protein LptE/RlpB
MKKLLTTILAILALTACSYQLNQYTRLSTAFQAGCEYSTIESSLSTEGNTLVLTAKCTKAK